MIDSNKVIDAIKVLNPNASVVVYGDTDSVLTCTILWHNGTEEISREDIKTEYDKLWNLAIVILKKKSVFVENEKYSIPCILFYSHNI